MSEITGKPWAKTQAEQLSGGIAELEPGIEAALVAARIEGALTMRKAMIGVCKVEEEAARKLIATQTGTKLGNGLARAIMNTAKVLRKRIEVIPAPDQAALAQLICDAKLALLKEMWQALSKSGEYTADDVGDAQLTLKLIGTVWLVRHDAKVRAEAYRRCAVTTDEWLDSLRNEFEQWADEQERLAKGGEGGRRMSDQHKTDNQMMQDVKIGELNDNEQIAAICAGWIHPDDHKEQLTAERAATIEECCKAITAELERHEPLAGAWLVPCHSARKALRSMPHDRSALQREIERATAEQREIIQELREALEWALMWTGICDCGIWAGDAEKPEFKHARECKWVQAQALLARVPKEQI